MDNVYTLIGLEEIHYINKAGRAINGIRVHMSQPARHGTGEICRSEYLSDECVAGMGYIPSVGDAVQALYNQYGRCIGVLPVADHKQGK